MSGYDLIFTPVLLPLLGSAIALFSKAFFRGKSGDVLEYAAVVIGLFLPWLLLFAILPDLLSGEVYAGTIGGWQEGVGISYRFDGLAWLVNFLGFTVAMAAWLYSQGPGPKGAKFSAVFLIQTGALAATAMTADLFNLFVCLEVMGIASYVLVSLSEKPGAYLAAFSYLMVSATAMIFFLGGLYGFYRLTGALSYEGVAAGLSVLEDGGGLTALVSLALIVSAVALRVAVMPLYGWLPDAHAMAPHSISAVLSGVLIKTPLFALSRILMVFPSGPEAGRLLGYAGGVTALVAVIIALSQKDAKKLLAYHSISQIGYVVCAWGGAISLGVNTGAGLVLMTAAFLHAFYHALFKGTLFLTVGTLTDRAGERNVYRLRGGAAILRRSGEKIPVTLISFFLAAMAISAIPPLNGFASKSALSYALKGRWEYTVLTIASIGTVASFIKLSRIFLPRGKKNNELSVPGEAPSRVLPAMKIAELFLAFICLAAGLLSSQISLLAGRLLNPSGVNAVVKAIPPDLYSQSNLLKTAVTVIVGFILFLLCSTKQGKTVMRMIRERPRSYHGLFVSFALGLAAMAAWLFYLS
jgi:multicomponent Na+:H+ antiporter subunit D